MSIHRPPPLPEQSTIRCTHCQQAPACLELGAQPLCVACALRMVQIRKHQATLLAEGTSHPVALARSERP